MNSNESINQLLDNRPLYQQRTDKILRYSLFMKIGILISVCPPAVPAAQDHMVPYGSPDFYPSPQQPIGHRGDGSGCYPGANPVSVWWEGKPQQDYKVTSSRGKSIDDWSLPPNTSKNIVWKSTMPSWANTQPIIVGDHIFTYGEPDQLYCINAHTGAIRWQRRLSPWLCSGQSEQQVKIHEQLYDIYLALECYELYRKRKSGTSGRIPQKDHFPDIHDTFINKCLPRLGKILNNLDPERNWATYIENDKALSTAIHDAVQANMKKVSLPRNLTTIRKAIRSRIGNINGQTVQLATPWGHMVGHLMNCPVSDGKHVYAQLGHGQVAALDMDGTIVWKTLLERGEGNELHIRSPLLAENILIVTIGGSLLRGLDVSNGTVLWETPCPGTNPRHIGSDAIVYLGTPSKREAYVVTTHCHIIRVADGVVAGKIPYQKLLPKKNKGIGGGPSMIVIPQTDGTAIIVKGASADAYNAPYTPFRLSLHSEGVLAQPLYESTWKTPGFQGLVVHKGCVLDGKGLAMDIAQGHSRTIARVRACNYSMIVAGTLFIAHDAKSESNSWRRRRPDHVTLCRFACIDITDMANTRVCSDRNVLGSNALPHYPPAETYIPELWQNKNFVNGSGGYVPHFIHCDTAITALANRLFIRSTGHLYCIGDPKEEFSWNPESNKGRIIPPKPRSQVD